MTILLSTCSTLILSLARMTVGYKCLQILGHQLWYDGIKWPWPRWYFWCGELIPFFMQKNQSSKTEWHKSNIVKEKQNKTKLNHWVYFNILIFLFQYAEVLPGNCPTQIFMNVRLWSSIAFARRLMNSPMHMGLRSLMNRSLWFLEMAVTLRYENHFSLLKKILDMCIFRVLFPTTWDLSEWCRARAKI